MSSHRPFADLKKDWSVERLTTNRMHKADLRDRLSTFDCLAVIASAPRTASADSAGRTTAESSQVE